MCIIFAHGKLYEKFVRYIVDLLPKALSVLMFQVKYFFKSWHIHFLGYFLIWHFDSPNYNNETVSFGDTAVFSTHKVLHEKFQFGGGC